ncbi:hypothetical protein PsorP6_000129 [Peronosclerospora sorghi]|uniref:Uncharacterized protein n=1 Tax=Peronosclerospora sorghi TaxID=230839 RepID=A0ACC0WXW3_9STRA|nr:hypothetical protein PsorP6_000129 [Peronosclerospora sorghi]
MVVADRFIRATARSLKCIFILVARKARRRGIPFDAEEQVVEKDLESALQRLPLRNPKSIASLLNQFEEEPAAHEELTDNETIKLVQDAEGGRRTEESRSRN